MVSELGFRRNLDGPNQELELYPHAKSRIIWIIPAKHPNSGFFGKIIVTWDMGHCWRMMLRNLEHTNPVQLFNYSKPLWDVIGHSSDIMGHYWELRDIIGTLFGHYFDIMGQTWNIQTLFSCSFTANHYRTLLDIMGTLWDIIGTLLGHYGTNLEHTNPVQLFSYSKPLWDIIRPYWDIMKHYWELWDIIGTLFGHYGTTLEQTNPDQFIKYSKPLRDVI